MTQSIPSSARNLCSKLAGVLGIAATLAYGPLAHAEDLRTTSSREAISSAPTLPPTVDLGLQHDPCDDVWAFIQAENPVPGFPKMAQVALIGGDWATGLTSSLAVQTDAFGRYEISGPFGGAYDDMSGEVDVRLRRTLNQKAMRYEYSVSMSSCQNEVDCNYPRYFSGTPTECTATDAAASMILRQDSTEQTIVIRFHNLQIGG